MPLTGTEGPGIEAWIYSRLANDATVQATVGSSPPRVYQGHVPEVPAGQPELLPAVVFASQGDDPDSRPVGRFRVMATRHYLVKAIVHGEDVTPIYPLVSRIDALLEGQTGVGTLAGINTTILSCTREHGFDYPETDKDTGEDYRHLGAVYKIQAQQTG